MLRKIIKIDQDKCTGCGACAAACHEGAIQITAGKAKLVREDYCDGLGDCLPACPVDAISFEEREAPAYNEAAVLAAKSFKVSVENKLGQKQSGGCPGTKINFFAGQGSVPRPKVSRLSQWPVQIKLAPVNAPYFQNADLLIAADCTAYAYGDFHEKFISNRITLIGCPKLDDVDYAEKLTSVITNNNIKSLTVVRMDVPCCGGIENAVKRALQTSGKLIPYKVVTISTDGRLLKEL